MFLYVLLSRLAENVGILLFCGSRMPGMETLGRAYALQSVWFAPAAADLEEPFFRLVDKSAPGGCWEWRGHILPGGYGTVQVGVRRANAHRVSYALLVGPIPDGMDLDHKCQNRKCVNPDHLHPVTRKVNIQLGWERRKWCGRSLHQKSPETWKQRPSGVFYCVPCAEAREVEAAKRRAALVERRSLGWKVLNGVVTKCPEGHDLNGSIRWDVRKFPEACRVCHAAIVEKRRIDRNAARVAREAGRRDKIRAAQKAWRLAHPGYWKAWRERNPTRKAASSPAAGS